MDLAWATAGQRFSEAEGLVFMARLAIAKQPERKGFRHSQDSLPQNPSVANLNLRRVDLRSTRVDGTSTPLMKFLRRVRFAIANSGPLTTSPSQDCSEYIERHSRSDPCHESACHGSFAARLDLCQSPLRTHSSTPESILAAAFWGRTGYAHGSA